MAEVRAVAEEIEVAFAVVAEVAHVVDQVCGSGLKFNLPQG